MTEQTNIIQRLREFAEMPLEGGDIDPVIEVMHGVAREAAAEIERLRGERLTIEVRQQDWMPGFAAYLDDGRQINGSAHVLLNIGASVLAVAQGDIPAADLPYHIADDLMHEIMHALEAWAGVEFSEDRIEALIAKYRAALSAAPEPSPRGWLPEQLEQARREVEAWPEGKRDEMRREAAAWEPGR